MCWTGREVVNFGATDELWPESRRCLLTPAFRPSKMPARPTSSRLPALGAILGLALVRLVTRREGTPAHHVPARAEPHAEEPERKPSNSAPSSHEASREPGRGREATSPTEIPAKGWKDIFWRVYEEINKDRILAVAAGVTFYGLLGLFPALAALVSIYGLFADPATIQDHLNLLSGVLPGGALDIIGEQVKRITSKGSGALGFHLLLWSGDLVVERQCGREGGVRRPQCGLWRGGEARLHRSEP